MLIIDLNQLLFRYRSVSVCLVLQEDLERPAAPSDVYLRHRPADQPPVPADVPQTLEGHHTTLQVNILALLLINVCFYPENIVKCLKCVAYNA